MSIRIQCTRCGKTYRLQAKLAGRKVKCKCGHAMVVPDPSDSAAVSAEGLPVPTDETALPNELPSLKEQPLAEDAFDGGFGDLSDLAQQAEALPTVPLAPTSIPNAPSSSKASKRTNQDSQKLIRVAAIAGGVVLAAAAVVTLFLIAIREPKPGHASPQEALAAYRRAVDREEWKDLYCTLDEASGEKMLRTMVGEVLPLAQSREEIKAVLQKHCGSVPVVRKPEIDSPTFDPAKFQEFQTQVREHSLSLVAAVPEKAEFYDELVVAIRDAEERFMSHNALLKMLAKKPSIACRRELSEMPSPKLEVDGNTARGEFSVTIEGGEFDDEFVLNKTSDRWFIQIADPVEFAHSLVGCTFVAGGVFYPL